MITRQATIRRIKIADGIPDYKYVIRKRQGKGKPFKKGKTRDPNDPYWKIPDFGTALGDARVVLFTITQFSELTNIYRLKIPVQLQRSNLPGYVVHTPDPSLVSARN